MNKDKKIKGIEKILEDIHKKFRLFEFSKGMWMTTGTIVVDKKLDKFLRKELSALMREERKDIINEVCLEIAQFAYLDDIETKKLIKIIRSL